MLIIGHRGASELAPENTLKSIQVAIESNVDMIEIDIAVCSTGETMLLHDDKIDRCTNGQGYIADLSFDFLRKLDAGEGELIPTLQEVLNLIDGRLPLNIEIKGKGSSNEVANILKNEIAEKGRRPDDFLVSSFDHTELVCFKKICPEIRISPIISCHPVSLAALADDMGAWSLNMKREYVSREIIEDAHKRGIKVLIFTVNHPVELSRLKELKVDGVFTNNRYRLLGL
ncbi:MULTISPECIES: glycerophosphodiester phosphodiesterase family protein [unclassified Oceanispirochaeta]|uniref:glycerophosphodiester phosphodiesterase n=1 Tax=unclassified Oceanispirochaeta TaxID=2635722 RepID=UPI000E08D870|nr:MULTISPECIES: glycerophosphodiester phosphodiesterase family protein [unclassified Oceanispirochaeta]MBF9018241.1 glycerophosphodiester phosphodiesterase [Oceanispirochaeta sp. M2]NPD74720.1 glycerophosphodiester phosphodiesterase [Oceanispirochaeta sp. M1]RDG29445.1 glycerophosphodiester phosphodiesterase [Oceanispirochaeta sp. M1]